jgi:hypothetical protein
MPVGAGLNRCRRSFYVMIAGSGAEARAEERRLHSVGLGRRRIAAAIRVVGLFAGGLVALAVLLEQGRKGVVMLAAYGLLALVVTYLFWPFLWSSPLRQLAEAASVMARFPDHAVLFRGSAITSGDLPWDYRQPCSRSS